MALFELTFRNASLGKWSKIDSATTRSVEDETPNARRNPNRNPEWWRDFSQQVEIEKLKFFWYLAVQIQSEI